MRGGVDIQTLRYYEQRGLIVEPGRSNGGHRLYPPDTVGLLKVIKAAQRLGFSLGEVAELPDRPHLQGLPDPVREEEMTAPECLCPVICSKSSPSRRSVS